MKISPFVRIREKNKEIGVYKHQINDIALLLGCQPILPDILDAMVEALHWKGSYMAAMTDNDELRVKMGKTIQEQVDKLTFNLQLENKQLQGKVDNLQKIVDTKDNEVKDIRQKNQVNKKGFWDFLYKVFKLV